MFRKRCKNARKLTWRPKGTRDELNVEIENGKIVSAHANVSDSFGTSEGTFVVLFFHKHPELSSAVYLDIAEALQETLPQDIERPIVRKGEGEYDYTKGGR